MEKRFDVFISYSSEDQKIAEGVCGYLERNGYRCFVAYRDIPPSKDFAVAISDAINESAMMIAVFSKFFNISPHTDREIALASKKKMPILTYRIADDELTGAKEYYLTNLNWIDAFPNPESYFGQLLDSVERLIGHRIVEEDKDNQKSSKRSNCPIGAIDGIFSVSPTKKVYFSKGNLQFQASTGIWRFAENQYETIGYDNSKISPSNSDWIDLFGWGTSGYNHGASCYQPWSTSKKNKHYYAYGDYLNNLNDQTGKADWGYNIIENGGRKEHQWHTLTSKEWKYLFEGRCTSSGILFAPARIGGIKGVVILPDNWKESVFHLVSTNGKASDINVISVMQWEKILQVNGAVFLPVCPSRNESVVSNVDTDGFYWSSSGYLGFGAESVSFHLWSWHFFVVCCGSTDRRIGISVRLVQTAK